MANKQCGAAAGLMIQEAWSRILGIAVFQDRHAPQYLAHGPKSAEQAADNGRRR
jgi:hypothetical protein